MKYPRSEMLEETSVLDSVLEGGEACEDYQNQLQLTTMEAEGPTIRPGTDDAFSLGRIIGPCVAQGCCSVSLTRKRY